MDKGLLLVLMNGESKHSPKHDFKDSMQNNNKVFVAESENSICKFWNSSNQHEFNRSKACNHIAQAILEDEYCTSGSFTFPGEFNEIMFEISEK